MCVEPHLSYQACPRPTAALLLRRNDAPCAGDAPRYHNINSLSAGKGFMSTISLHAARNAALCVGEGGVGVAQGGAGCVGGRMQASASHQRPGVRSP